MERIVVYSDYVCPFCYLAWAGVRDLIAGGADVELRAFELRPAPLPVLRELDAGKRQAWDRFILPTAERLGLPARLPTVFPRTRKAHEAAHHARTLGLGVAMHERLFHAYFAEGLDIGRIDVLVELGESVGIDRSSMKVELDIDQYTDAVLTEAERAQHLGVQAVPAYITESDELRAHVGLLEPAELRAWVNAGRSGPGRESEP